MSSRFCCPHIALLTDQCEESTKATDDRHGFQITR
jgi:hypothetical protein